MRCQRLDYHGNGVSVDWIFACTQLPQLLAHHNDVQHLAKLSSKADVAEWIEKGIHRRVEVTDPRDRRHQLTADAPITERHDREANEIRQKANGEGAHDDPQLPGRLDVPLQG